MLKDKLSLHVTELRLKYTFYEWCHFFSFFFFDGKPQEDVDLGK